jgi:hypothetical protein
MRWTPVDVDLIGALEAAAQQDPPLFLVGPPGVETEDEICRLLAREARGYHQTERDVLRRRLAELEQRLEELTEGAEHDRAGEPTGGISLPGHQQLLDRRSRLVADLGRHHTALQQVGSDAHAERLRELLGRFELRPRGALEQLKRAESERGQVVELFADGYGLADSLPQALAARRATLGLPADRDWE